MPRNHEELTQLALNLVDADRTVQWGLGDYAREDHEGNGVSCRQIASEWGFATSTIRKMIKVATLFPRPEDRNPELSFSHYIIAAATTRPADWVAWAADTHASTRDLRDAVNVAKARDPQEEQRRQADAALQRLRKVWQEADDALRESLRGPLTTWWEEEVACHTIP